MIKLDPMFELFKQRKSVLLAGAIMGLYISVFTTVLTAKNQKKLLMQDITAFLTGSYILRQGRVGVLYDPRVQISVAKEIRDFPVTGLLSFRNPPLIAFMFLPLTYFDTYVAIKIYFAYQLTVLTLFLFYLLKRQGMDCLYVFPVLLSAQFITNLIYGQIMGLFFIVLYFIYLSLKNHKDLYVGLLCFFLLLKPQYVILLPFLFILVRNKLKFVQGFIVASVLFILSNMAIYGTSFLNDYISFVFLSEQISMGTNLVYSYTLTSYADHFLGLPVRNKVYLVTLVISAILYCFGLVSTYIKRKKLSLEVLFFVSLVFAMNTNLHTMPADVILFLLPYLYFVRYSGILRKIAWIIYFLPLFGFLHMSCFAAVGNILIAIYLLYEYSKKHNIVDPLV